MNEIEEQMKENGRDIKKYTEDYLKKSFEDYQVKYRRKKVLEVIRQYQPKRLLEIGCGSDPLIKYLDKDIKLTVVEPSEVFYKNLNNYKRPGDEFYNDFFENIADNLTSSFDMILCAGLLSEIQKPEIILNDILRIMGKDSLLHISVPNAYSLHRLIAKEMGLINDVYDFSERNVKFQQAKVYDMEGLCSLVSNAGFQIISKGSFFLKPFTHHQMFRLLEEKIIDEEVLNGMYSVCKFFQGYGSEIYVNAII